MAATAMLEKFQISSGDISATDRPIHFMFGYTSDENKVIHIAKCDAFSGVCESIQ